MYDESEDTDLLDDGWATTELDVVALSGLHNDCVVRGFSNTSRRLHDLSRPKVSHCSSLCVRMDYSYLIRYAQHQILPPFKLTFVSFQGLPETPEAHAMSGHPLSFRIDMVRTRSRTQVNSLV